MPEQDQLFLFLRKNTFFDDLSDEHLRELLDLARLQSIPAGEHFMRIGDPATYLAVLRQGVANLGVMSEGGRVVVVDKLERHAVIGWSAIVPPHEWSYDAVALSELDFVLFDAVRLREKCEREHKFGVQMMTCIARTITRRLTATRMSLLNNAL